MNCRGCKRKLIFKRATICKKCYDQIMKEYWKKKLERLYKQTCYHNKISQWKYDLTYI